MTNVNRTLSLLALSSCLCACAGPPPVRPLGAASCEAIAAQPDPDGDGTASTDVTDVTDGDVTDDPLARALRDYDAGALARLLDAPPDARTAALAAHGLGEILRLEASLAEGRQDDALLEALTARRAEVARRGLTAVAEALAAAPGDVALLVARGELRAYLIDGLRTGLLYGRVARKELQAALTRAPRDPDARLAWAKQLYYLPGSAGGDLARAAQELEAVVADAPDHEPTWGFLGQVYLALGREDAARAALTRALCLNPRSARGRAWLLREEDQE